VQRELRTCAIAVSVGITVGVLVGGIGSRLAMRAIAATSDPRLRGVLTSDQEPIGEITLGGTIGLILFVGVVGGALLGLGYVALRWLLPDDLRLRAVCASLLVWTVGGSAMFDAEDFDFRFLEPGWLSVLLFSAIFLAAGWITAAGIEVAERRWPADRRGWWRYAPLLLLLPVVPLLAVAVVLVLVRSTAAAERLATSAPIVLVGRVVLVIGGLALALPAVGEVIEIV